MTRKYQKYLESRGGSVIWQSLWRERSAGNRLHGYEQASGRCGLCIVLGGDGTFIQTVRDFVGLDIPMVGINLGTVGFLAAIDVDELHDGLDA